MHRRRFSFSSQDRSAAQTASQLSSSKPDWRLLKRCSTGAYAAIVASPLCSTFSVNRFFEADVPDGGPPPVRDRDNITGLSNVPAAHQRELLQANILVERTASLLRAGRDAGSEYLLEHPADRGHVATSRSRLLRTHHFPALRTRCARAKVHDLPLHARPATCTEPPIFPHMHSPHARRPRWRLPRGARMELGFTRRLSAGLEYDHR
eukprot:6212109-Pleurochrysis_carterae.AAC.1